MLHFFIILGTKVLNHYFTGFTTVQVYEIFGHLALLARSSAYSYGSSFANELLMIVRKQVPRIIFFSFGALQHKHDQTSLNHTFVYDHYFTLSGNPNWSIPSLCLAGHSSWSELQEDGPGWNSKDCFLSRRCNRCYLSIPISSKIHQHFSFTLP